ncbi:MAG: efflux RND transporter permease subunit, partial [Blautia sp.]|nr:efflux RND transporter permease subunit [Blautia sp.]
PMIMKINPDMLPIMIAAVEIDDLSATEVTDYVENHIEAELESVAGVASVSTTGNITESVNVVIREEKIKEVNQKVLRAVNSSFKEKEEELQDAKEELEEGQEALEEGKEELEKGKEQLESGKDQMASGLSEGAAQMASAEAQLEAGEAEIAKNEQTLNEKQTELTEGLEKIADGRSQAQSGVERLNEAKSGIRTLQQAVTALDEKETELNGSLALIDQGITQLTEAQDQLNAVIAQLEQGIPLTPQQLQILQQAQSSQGISQGSQGSQQQNPEQGSSTQSGSDPAASVEPAQSGDGQWDSSDYSDFEVLGRVFPFHLVEEVMASSELPTDLSAQLTELQNQVAQLEEQKNQLLTQRETVSQGITEIQNQKRTLSDQLDQAVSSLGQPSASEALSYLDTQISTLTQTIAELNTTEAQLQQGQEQLDAGRTKLEQAKQQVAAGKAQLAAGKTQLDIQGIMAAVQMSSAEIKLAAGESEIKANEQKIEEARSQIDAGMDQLKDAKKQVKEQVNLNNLVSKNLIKGILAGENFSMPAGYLNEGQDEYLVRVGDKLDNMQNIGDLVLLDLGMDDLDPIRLSDVADVSMQDDSDSVYARLNGQPGVMLTIEKQTGYSTGDVTDRLLARLDEIEAEQSNVHFSVLMNQGIYIDLVVNSVISNMLSGAALAILILLLFLKDLRPTIVIGFSIPISVVTAFVLMYFSNITLNVISLSGLALGIGMLVDNSIVVIENIDRLRQNGVPARKAAIAGANEVAGAIAASTLTTVCVFAPIVFTEGITRQLFVDMGLTIAYSLLASLVVALTLVPAMSAGLLRKTKPKKFRILDAIRTVYGKILAGALHVKILVILLAAGLLVWSGYQAIRKGTAFMPEMESTQATMTIRVENGTPFSDLVSVADEALSRIEDIEDIESIGAMSGGGTFSLMSGSSGGTSVTAYLLLKEEKTLSNTELEKELLNRTKGLPCQIEVSTQTMDMSALGGSGIQVRIKGRDLDRLSELAKDIAKIVEETEGTQNVSDGQEESDKEFRIIVNKAKAMEHQLTVAQVFQEIQGRLAEAASATTLSTDEKDYSVYVNDEKDTSLTRADLENYSFEVTKQDGEKETVKLSEIADFVDALGPQTINRDSQSRYMTVSAVIDSEHNIGLVSNELAEKLAYYQLNSGYTIEMTGEDETINDAMEQLFLMLALAVAFMYLIMVAQFQSLLSPFIVMFTIPLAFTGGFMGLLVADMEVSVIAMIGFIMLSGIIVNNGIVLVDYTNQLRAEGMEKREALIQAGKDRLRPIVMTALTTILGLSTMAAGGGMGGDLVQPMAVVTIGGLIYGTLLTLFVVPCIYDLLNRKKYRRFDEDIEEEDEKDGNAV